jgi:hypothetical protein
MAQGPRVGTLQDIHREAAQFGEHGYVLVFRDMANVDEFGGFEAIPVQVKTENGASGMGLRIGPDLYFTGIDELEAVLAPDNRGSGESEGSGTLVVFRYAREIEDQELFQRMEGGWTRDGQGLVDLRVGEERYLFGASRLWKAMIDPSTFREDDDGPIPVDALR